MSGLSHLSFQFSISEKSECNVITAGYASHYQFFFFLRFFLFLMLLLLLLLLLMLLLLLFFIRKSLELLSISRYLFSARNDKCIFSLQKWTISNNNNNNNNNNTKLEQCFRLESGNLNSIWTCFKLGGAFSL